jgi:two-component system, NtrC family, response regulator AtoC
MMKKSNAAFVDDKSPYAANLKALLSKRGYEARSFVHHDDLVAWARQYDASEVLLLDAIPRLKRLPLKTSTASHQDAETIVPSVDAQHFTPVDGDWPDALTDVSQSETPVTRVGSACGASMEGAIEWKRLEAIAAGSHTTGDEDGCIWGTGDQMRSISRSIDQIADSDITVLLRGESGVGKGLVAQALHDRSTRRTRSFVKVNCAALPAELIESELFGHERGAFTGAVSPRMGKFEQADGGTLLLDEIGEMKPAVQAKLLQVLQDGEFTRLGSNKTIRTDVRVVAATNCNLEQMRVSGEFREDLYFRLGVIELRVPPLRERRDEIPTFVDLFMERGSRQYGRRVQPLSAQLRRLFAEYDWPGNVRELENMIKRIVVLQDEQPVAREIEYKLRHRETTRARMATAPATTVSGEMGSAPATLAGAGRHGAGWSPAYADLPAESLVAHATAGEEPTLVAVAKAAATRAEHAAILQMLSKMQWNRRKAAQTLGISYKTLLNKMKVCGITHS